MPKERNSDQANEPVQTIRLPLCYGCGVAIDEPGMCARCEADHLKNLETMLARMRSQASKKKDSPGPRAITKNPLTDKQKADLAREHAHVREHYKPSDEVPF